MEISIHFPFGPFKGAFLAYIFQGHFFVLPSIQALRQAQLADVQLTQVGVNNHRDTSRWVQGIH